MARRQEARKNKGDRRLAAHTPIMTVSDDSRLRVYCYVQQADVPYIAVGDVADIVDGRDSRRYRHTAQRESAVESWCAGAVEHAVNA